MTNCADKRLLARVLPEMVLQVNSCLEGFITNTTFEVPDVVVV